MGRENWIDLRVLIDPALFEAAKNQGLITHPRRASALLNMALKYFLENYKRGKKRWTKKKV